MSGARISVIGLGPAGLDRVSNTWRTLLADPSRRVLVRTLEHPAAAQLAALRELESGDHHYQQAESLEDAYQAMAAWVLEAARTSPVVYAVPGSPGWGERTVELLRVGAAAAGLEMEVVGGESFLELVLARMGIDPLARGMQVLDARDLPYPLRLDLPTVIAQVDRPSVASSLKLALASQLGDEAEVWVLSDLGLAEEQVAKIQLSELDRVEVGPRTTVVVEGSQVGWPGVVAVVERLRKECPWDARQTHHSLVRHVVEEAYELVEALAQLSPTAPAPPVDLPVYLEVEEELGDLLLHALMHTTLAREAGVFDLDGLAEMLRRKLVHRHPHVFAGTEVSGATEVAANWERLKQEKKQRASLMDDIPAALPGLERAAKVQRRAATVGFDWSEPAAVIAKLREEIDELEASLDDPASAAAELGDVLFSVVNLARHLHLDSEMALRNAVERFGMRFRSMEAGGPLDGLDLAELDQRWEQAKADTQTDSRGRP